MKNPKRRSTADPVATPRNDGRAEWIDDDLARHTRKTVTRIAEGKDVSIEHTDGTTDTLKIDHIRKARKTYGRAWTIAFGDAARLIAACPLAGTITRVLWAIVATWRFYRSCVRPLVVA